MTEQKQVGRLHVITDEVLQDRFSHVELAASAAAGGADVVQYREKRQVSTKEMMRVAVLMSLGLPRVRHDAADRRPCGCSGGGRSIGGPPGKRGSSSVRGSADSGARRDHRWGLRTRSRRRSRWRSSPVDYLGVGPVFGTTSKGNRAAPMLGLERFGEICAAVDKPVIGIGSITADRVGDVLAAGAYGVAVLSAIVCQEDPQASCRAFVAEIERVLS